MRQFPKLPATKFDWFSIVWEPISQSGERIAAFVVVRENGAETLPKLHRCISRKHARCLLGDAFENMDALLEFSESLILEQLKAPANFGQGLAVGGFTIGRTGIVHAQSIAEAGRIAIREASLFGSAAMGTFSDEVIEVLQEQVDSIDQLSEDRFFHLVHKLVVEQSPTLDGKFRRSFKLTDNARGTRLDFAGEKLVANLHRLKPGRTLTQQVKFGKQKLLDLSSVRLWLEEQKSLVENEFHREFELLTHRPDTESIDFTAAEIRQVNEAVEELTYAADHHELRIRLYANVKGAADRILEVEA